MRERPVALLADLVLAHRILIDQDVLDAFGHVSVRDPARPDVFWLARACPPSRVEVDDLMTFGLDGAPLEPADAALFAERFIHAAIYAARGDVGAICHHHAPSIMPFCLADRPLVPVSQTGAAMGGTVPIWDSRDGFGATAMLVDGRAQADSLAARLGSRSMVLMRGHGATVTGRSLRELVFRAVYACRDADHLLQAARLGEITALSAEEIALASPPSATAIERSWSHWLAALDRAASFRS